MEKFGVENEDLGPDNGDTPLMRNLYFDIFLVLGIINSYYSVALCGDTPLGK